MRTRNLRHGLQLLHSSFDSAAAQSRRGLSSSANLPAVWALHSNGSAPLGTQESVVSAGQLGNRSLVNQHQHQHRQLSDDRGPGSGKTDISDAGPPGQEAVADAFERLILEAYKFLQEGEMEKAELLLMEGINSMEPELGKDAVELAQLWDQLALILFFQDKLQEAEPAAVRSLQIAMTHFQPHDAPLAMCQLRLGSIMLAQGKAQEALEPLGAARSVLQASLGTDFEAVGEAQFYSALANLYLTDRTNMSAVAGCDADLLQGLDQLRQNVGAGALLTATALREHYRLLEGEMAAENWLAVQALFRQQIRLVSALMPGSEDLSLLAYQFGTLQYCQGDEEEAVALLEQSLSIVKALYKDSDDQVLLRLHRLGTIKSGRSGEQAEAESLLQRSFKHFSSRLGSDNPLTGEARGYLALVQLRSLLAGHATADAFTRVLNPAKQKELISEMRQGIRSMTQGFGADHLLVQKAVADERELLAMCGAL